MIEHKLSFEDRLEKFLVNLKDYIDGKIYNTPNLIVNNSEKSVGVNVSISNNLAYELIKNINIYKKHLKALKHGYVKDNKGRNGIRDVHPNDGRIYKAATNVLIGHKGKDIFSLYNLNPNKTIAIKIVAHDPSLRRLYGLMDIEQNKVILYNVDKYN